MRSWAVNNSQNIIMKYIITGIKRVFVVKFEHKDELISELVRLVKKENIKSGFIQLLGALEKSEIVVGPKKVSVPPDPVWRFFDDGREILGFGTVFWKDDEPKIHIHAGIGREDKVNLGCIRKDAKVYLVVEAVLFELDTKIEKKFNPEMQIDLMEF